VRYDTLLMAKRVEGEWCETVSGTEDLGLEEGDEIVFEYSVKSSPDIEGSKMLSKEAEVKATNSKGNSVTIETENGKSWSLHCGSVVSHEREGTRRTRVGTLHGVEKK